MQEQNPKLLANLYTNLNTRSKVNTFCRWYERASSTEVWTQSDIIYFKKAISRRGIDCSKARQILKDRFRDTLISLEEGFEITSEQTEKGYDWLTNLAFRKDGTQRRTKDYPFMQYELVVLSEFKKFYFEGYAELCWGLSYAPLYQVVGENGSFSYYYDQGSITLV